ncbi:uncharacterized protein B0T23DRAFT_433232 [Neurospora hispaniola]|uniref:Uncharacterized protein n=1 Tax=Neurospora hispaniola TaxID=588809 RepID=A0AAJ0HYF4_9PEZI|nr:hypothetical protein B0T23DRAFT_433232 [Neurospora hispaniola]
MKILTFLFFADVVQISTWDRALQAVLELNTSTILQTLRIRRDRFSASTRQRNLVTTRHLHEALSEVSKESSLLRAIQIARDSQKRMLLEIPRRDIGRIMSLKIYLPLTMEETCKTKAGWLKHEAFVTDNSSNKGSREEEALDDLARLKDITHGMMDMRSISGTFGHGQWEQFGTDDWKNGFVRSSPPHLRYIGTSSRSALSPSCHLIGPERTQESTLATATSTLPVKDMSIGSISPGKYKAPEQSLQLCRGTLHVAAAP